MRMEEQENIQKNVQENVNTPQPNHHDSRTNSVDKMPLSPPTQCPIRVHRHREVVREQVAARQRPLDELGYSNHRYHIYDKEGLPLVESVYSRSWLHYQNDNACYPNVWYDEERVKKFAGPVYFGETQGSEVYGTSTPIYLRQLYNFMASTICKNNPDRANCSTIIQGKFEYSNSTTINPNIFTVRCDFIWRNFAVVTSWAPKSNFPWSNIQVASSQIDVFFAIASSPFKFDQVMPSDETNESRFRSFGADLSH